MEKFELGGILTIISSPHLSHGQRQIPLQQVAEYALQPSLELFQEWGIIYKFITARKDFFFFFLHIDS